MSRIDAENEVERIFAIVDQDNNECIDYTEFLSATMDRKKFLSKQRLRTAFQLFDNDGDGNIDVVELKKIFQQVKADEKVWNKMIKDVDDNNDGEINFIEFKNMMTKIA